MTKLDIYQKVIEIAKQDLAIAEQNLQYAELEFIKAAIFEVSAKREKLNELFKLAKKETEKSA